MLGVVIHCDHMSVVFAIPVLSVIMRKKAGQG